MDQQEPYNPALTSGFHASYWTHSEKPDAFPKLERDASADVLVVGGGIAGLTTAFCLSEEGKSVILVEDGEIGSGESGRTTAHITCALDDRYYDIEKYLGEDNARLAAQSHREAISFIRNVSLKYNFNCHFRILDGYLFLHESDIADNLDKEFEAVKRAGIDAEIVTDVPGIRDLPGGRAIKFPNQAQFHIMKYLNGLARKCADAGVQIYTSSRADTITSEGAAVNGFRITAGSVVVATNTPVNDIVTMHTKQAPYRSYVIGMTVPKDAVKAALWWDTGDQASKWPSYPYRYTRLESLDEEKDLLICGGEDHKTGQADSEDISEETRYERLGAWARKHFPMVEKIHYRWSGQVMEPVDCLGFMGRNPGDENIYIITGDSGNGMTHATIGGKIVSDLICQKQNPYTKLYDPARITFSTAGDFLSEQANVAKQYLDWLTPEETVEIDSILPGNGGIVSSGLSKKAVYRNDDGSLNVFSAVCPHLACIVHWNTDEKTFDCPCHGSRFSTLGEVLNGPANTNLKPVTQPQNK